MADDLSTELERLRLERDLYLGLLDLNDRRDAGVFLEEALRRIVRVLDAAQAYVEVSDPHEGPSWWRAAGCSDEEVERIRSIVSRGIIAEALALGKVVACPSALLDPRFRDRPSVQASQIEAVLCVPVVQRTPIGVPLHPRAAEGAGPSAMQRRIVPKHLRATSRPSSRACSCALEGRRRATSRPFERASASTASSAGARR